ncbi:MAG: hypothetical protein AB9846_00255 [Tenuifilaceae bacterium]
MDSLYLDFSDTDSLSGRQKFLGILFAFIGFLGTMICFVDQTFGYLFYLNLFWLFYGVAMLTPYPYRISTKNKPFFKVDNNAIEYKTTPFTIRPKRIEWSDISSITLKPRILYVESISGKKIKISLNWISFKNVIIIKQAVSDYASSKGLMINKFYS